MSQHNDREHKIQSSCGNLYDRHPEDPARAYTKGTVTTLWGIVNVYSEQRRNGGYTTLSFAWQGVYYRRDFDKAYSQRYIVTLATEFAAEKSDYGHGR